MIKIDRVGVEPTTSAQKLPLSMCSILNSITIFLVLFSCKYQLLSYSNGHTWTDITMHSLLGLLFHPYFGVQMLKTNKLGSGVRSRLQRITLLYLQLRISGELTFFLAKRSKKIYEIHFIQINSLWMLWC